jgi:glycosyltransferase involved in cell wall biosynthesis
VRAVPQSPVFLLIARLLRDKGVGEFVEAARVLRREGVDARFQLLGPLGVANRTAVPRAELDAWVGEGLVEYLGEKEDVRPWIAKADCVVLPSYREGTPRVLLEAAAMGRPVIATDVPGCREVLEEGVNGLFCRVRDSADLAEKMRRMVKMTRGERAAMGMAGRAKMEREFDQRIVIGRYMEAIDEAMRSP